VDASVGLSTAAGQGGSNPPNHPSGNRYKGLDPRLIPVTWWATYSASSLGAATDGIWLTAPRTPSQGKLWNIRSVNVVSSDTNLQLNKGASTTLAAFNLQSGQRLNGQTGNAEPAPDVVTGFIDSVTASPQPSLSFSRYAEWVRPGEYLAALVISQTVLAAGNGVVAVRFQVDQYDESDILPRWQG
jgi:hypothetical protein